LGEQASWIPAMVFRASEGRISPGTHFCLDVTVESKPPTSGRIKTYHVEGGVIRLVTTTSRLHWLHAILTNGLGSVEQDQPKYSLCLRIPQNDSFDSFRNLPFTLSDGSSFGRFFRPG
jgi:hypothetical protein